MVARGTQEYQCDCDPCLGSGWSWSQSELDAALTADVHSLVYDEVGRNACIDMLAAASTTGFDMSVVGEIFQTPSSVRNWEVGECIASAYIRDNRNCFVPWNTRRDVRNPQSSLPGVDICGIQDCGGHSRLFFCEVKTSAERRYPPQVASMSGEGLGAQVVELRDDANVRHTVIQYLAHRAINASWKDRFSIAVRNYCSARHTDFCVFGFMVRDVPPDKKDLNARVRTVASGGAHCSAIEFIALYLPVGSIASLGSRVEGVAGRRTTS